MKHIGVSDHYLGNKDIIEQLIYFYKLWHKQYSLAALTNSCVLHAVSLVRSEQLHQPVWGQDLAGIREKGCIVGRVLLKIFVLGIFSLRRLARGGGLLRGGLAGGGGLLRGGLARDILRGGLATWGDFLRGCFCCRDRIVFRGSKIQLVELLFESFCNLFFSSIVIVLYQPDLMVNIQSM